LTFDVSAERAIEIRRLALISAAEAAQSTTHELTVRVREMLETAP